MDEINKTNYYNSYNNFQMIWKSYQVLRDGLKLNNEELDTLIDYHSRNEDYEICEQLLKLKV